MPSYQFNTFTGRVKESFHLQPLYPTSIGTSEKKEPPKMIWDSIKTKSVKSVSSTASYSTVDPNLLMKYKKFQANLEKPVYLAGGMPDKILFGLTLGLVVANSIYSLYRLAQLK